MSAGHNLVVGRHAVAEVLAQDPGSVMEVLAASGQKGRSFERVASLAREARVKLRRVHPRDLDALAQGAAHQGVAAVLAAQPYADLADVVEAARKAGDRGLVVVADHLEDPHNLGAVIRSAAAAGAQGVVMPKDRAAPLGPAAAKASAGALALVPVARVVNLSQALEELKQAGLWALAAATRQAPAPWDLDLTLPLALVVGGEHKGVGQRLLKACDLQASLPLARGVESLNASVAAGVLLFEIARQRAVKGTA